MDCLAAIAQGLFRPLLKARLQVLAASVAAAIFLCLYCPGVNELVDIPEEYVPVANLGLFFCVCFCILSALPWIWNKILQARTSFAEEEKARAKRDAEENAHKEALERQTAALNELSMEQKHILQGYRVEGNCVLRSQDMTLYPVYQLVQAGLLIPCGERNSGR